MSRAASLQLLGFALLAALAVGLRSPTFGHAVWNVDEAIHAAVARELLDGGVLYRDAIDQRTPLSYYAIAAVFAVAGPNNLYAVHVLIALLIAATAFLLWRTGIEWRHPGAGAWAAILYVLYSVAVPYRGDAFASNTEWFVAGFTSLAAWCCARSGADANPRWLFAAGLALGGAFLSKQPALLDATAPVLVLVWLTGRRSDGWRALPLRGAALAAGWALPVSLVALWFARHGALGDAVYYTWTYNLQIYGPEVSGLERLRSGLKLWTMFQQQTPLVLPWTLLALALAVYHTARRGADLVETSRATLLVYGLAWGATSWSGAVAGGRGFDHYFISTFPALSLLTGWLFHRVGRAVLDPRRRALTRVVAAALLTTTVASLGMSAFAQRQQTLPPDSSVRAAAEIRSLTQPGERLFVWGYHPEFFLFSGRQTASRFVYSSFLTGLVPWSNTAAEIATDYAIVPGALATLMTELETRRPTFIVDCSAGPNRFWQKYPLAKFPPLHAFVQRHYVLVDPERFRGQGYDLYLIRDESRRTRPAPAQGVAPAELAKPRWFGQQKVPNQPGYVTLAGSCARGQLTQLELHLGGRQLARVSFAPSKAVSLRIPVPFADFAFGRHAVEVRATAADGSQRVSEAGEIEVSSTLLPARELASFALPYQTGPLLPLFVETLFGTSVEREDGRTTILAHAPSTLAFPLPAEARELSGAFGFRAGAWDVTRPSPTDGAEFRIELVSEDGTRQVLFRRLLQPTTVALDRNLQSLRVSLPERRTPGMRVEFITAPGPHDSPATDWTFWQDLRIESSR